MKKKWFLPSEPSCSFYLVRLAAVIMSLRPLIIHPQSELKYTEMPKIVKINVNFHDFTRKIECLQGYRSFYVETVPVST